MKSFEDKTYKGKSQPMMDEASEKSNVDAPTFQFKDNRPEAIAQRKLQENVNARNQVTQLVKKATKTLGIKIPRPGFIGSVDDMRTDAQGMYPGETIHMAHRMSWQQIELIVRGGNTAQIDSLIQSITIPQRDFGDPANGGVAAGNLDYFNAVQQVVKKYGQVSRELAKALNSSPYNLRPGDGPTNSAIGGDPDAHFDETLPGEPMTPQSKALLPPGTQDSSDFMTMGSFQDWESNFYNDYVKKAIASAHNI